MKLSDVLIDFGLDLKVESDDDGASTKCSWRQKLSEVGGQATLCAIAILALCHFFQQLVQKPDQFTAISMQLLILVILAGLLHFQATIVVHEVYAMGLACTCGLAGCLARSDAFGGNGVPVAADLAFCAPQFAMALLRLPARNSQMLLLGHLAADSAVLIASFGFGEAATHVLPGSHSRAVPTMSTGITAALLISTILANGVVCCLCLLESYTFEVTSLRTQQATEGGESGLALECVELAEKLLAETSDCVIYTEASVTLTVVSSSPKLEEIFGGNVVGKSLLCQAHTVQESWRLMSNIGDLVVSVQGHKTPLMLLQPSFEFTFQHASGEPFHTSLVALRLPAQANRAACIAVGLRLTGGQGPAIASMPRESPVASLASAPSVVKESPVASLVSAPPVLKEALEASWSTSRTPEAEMDTEGSSPSSQQTALIQPVVPDLIGEDATLDPVPAEEEAPSVTPREEAPPPEQDPEQDAEVPTPSADSVHKVQAVPKPAASEGSIQESSQGKYRGAAPPPPPTEVSMPASSQGSALLQGQNKCPAPPPTEASFSPSQVASPDRCPPPPMPEVLRDKKQPGGCTVAKDESGAPSQPQVTEQPRPTASGETKPLEIPPSEENRSAQAAPAQRADLSEAEPPSVAVSLAPTVGGHIPRASAGSHGHPHSCEPPCKFALSIKGCKDGDKCLRCHLCKWKKPKKVSAPAEVVADESVQADIRQQPAALPQAQGMEPIAKDSFGYAEPRASRQVQHTTQSEPGMLHSEHLNPGLHQPCADDVPSPGLMPFGRSAKYGHSASDYTEQRLATARASDFTDMGLARQSAPTRRLRFSPGTSGGLPSDGQSSGSFSRAAPQSGFRHVSLPNQNHHSRDNGQGRTWNSHLPRDPGENASSSRQEVDAGECMLNPPPGLNIKSKNTFLHCDSESLVDMMSQIGAQRPVSDPGVFQHVAGAQWPSSEVGCEVPRYQ